MSVNSSFSSEHEYTPAKENILLPAKLFLTDEGVHAFASSSSSANISEMFLFNGSKGRGFESSSYTKTVLQKLLLNSYVQEFYVQQPQLLNLRQQIIALNHLIVYAALYQKLTPTLAQDIFASPALQQYNQKNPKRAIYNFQDIEKSKASAFCKQHQSFFQFVQKELYALIVKKLETDHFVSEDERELRKEAVRKFLQWIDPRISYLYLVLYRSDIKEELRSSFVNSLYRYLENMQLASHLSNLLMEFVQNAERAHFERLIKKHHLSSEKPDVFLRSPQNRKKICEIAVKHQQYLDLVWNLYQTQEKTEGRQTSFSIHISNYGVIDEHTRSLISAKMKTEVKETSISSFFQERANDSLGAGLGLLYNSYLEDFCRERHIRYFCQVFPEPHKEKTTVKIDITL